MKLDKRRMNPHCTAQISIVKSSIRNSNGRGFDGTGYIFKEAKRQLRKEGIEIIYDRKKCLYFLKEHLQKGD